MNLIDRLDILGKSLIFQGFSIASNTLLIAGNIALLPGKYKIAKTYIKKRNLKRLDKKENYKIKNNF